MPEELSETDKRYNRYSAMELSLKWATSNINLRWDVFRTALEIERYLLTGEVPE